MDHMQCQGFVVCGITVVNQYSRLVHFWSQKYVTERNVNVHITELLIHNPLWCIIHNFITTFCGWLTVFLLLFRSNCRFASITDKSFIKRDLKKTFIYLVKRSDYEVNDHCVHLCVCLDVSNFFFFLHCPPCQRNTISDATRNTADRVCRSG